MMLKVRPANPRNVGTLVRNGPGDHWEVLALVDPTANVYAVLAGLFAKLMEMRSRTMGVDPCGRGTKQTPTTMTTGNR